jgi:hypothetical protein
LSRRRWGLDWRRIWSAQLSEDFNIPERAVRRIFYDADREVGKTEREDVTPEDVAGVVEAVMAGGSAAEASNAG